MQRLQAQVVRPRGRGRRAGHLPHLEVPAEEENLRHQRCCARASRLSLRLQGHRGDVHGRKLHGLARVLGPLECGRRPAARQDEPGGHAGDQPERVRGRRCSQPQQDSHNRNERVSLPNREKQLAGQTA